MKQPNLGDLQSEFAALRAVTETELKNLGARMGKVEDTQAELVKVATTGKAGLRTLLWVGGAITAALIALAALWSSLGGGSGGG